MFPFTCFQQSIPRLVLSSVRMSTAVAMEISRDLFFQARIEVETTHGSSVLSSLNLVRSALQIRIHVNDCPRCSVCEVNHVVVHDECVTDPGTRWLQSTNRYSMTVKDLRSKRSHREPVMATVISRDMITIGRYCYGRCIKNQRLCP